MYCMIEKEYFQPHDVFQAKDMFVSVMIDCDDHCIHLKIEKADEVSKDTKMKSKIPTIIEAVSLAKELNDYIDMENERSTRDILLNERDHSSKIHLLQCAHHELVQISRKEIDRMGYL